MLSQEEVARLIDPSGSLINRAMLTTLYATGVHRAELCRLKVTDIDSERLVLHIHEGKGGRDREIPLSPKLFATLRDYWRWMNPRLFVPGHGKQVGGRRARHQESCVDCHDRSGEGSRHHQASLAAHAPAQLCDAPAGSGR